MKLADYVIRYLADMGIDTAFLVQGAANNDLIYAIDACPKMRYVCCQHEQAAGFAAEGWAKVKGLPGLAIGTSGPGGQNMVTCAANCYYDSVPCVFISGQINSRFMRPNNRIRQVGFQESPTTDIFRPIVKFDALIREPKTIRAYLQQALHEATSGRPGPVLLDICMDAQKAEVEAGVMVGFQADPPSYNLFRVKEQIAAFLDDLSKADRPVLLVGGGARHAADLVRRIARRLGVPCFPTWNAIDIITDDFPMFGGRIGTYGGKGRNIAIQKADLVLSIGSRVSGRITGGEPKTFMPHAKKYMVDVDTAMMDRETMQVKFDELICCDAKLFCETLLESAAAHLRSGWEAEVEAHRHRFDPVKPDMFAPGPVHLYAFFRELSRQMSDTDIMVSDCGGNTVAWNHAFETKLGQRVFSNHGNSPMGFSMCGAIGAAFAAPNRRVVCAIGDGGFQLNIQELQTIVKYKVPVKVFIINNEEYGITKAYQMLNMGRPLACGPDGYSVPDFEKIVLAYGLPYIAITHNEHSAGRIRTVLEHDGPIVCDVRCKGFHEYLPKIDGWNTPIHDMTPKLPREELEALMGN